MKFEKFVDTAGKTIPFYGVDCNKFKLGQTVFEAIEDENDGYRSYLESIVTKEQGIFFRRKLADVRVVEYNDGYFKGHTLIDAKDNHVWLKVGTSNIEDYYPYFTFEYTPKEPKK